MLGGGTKGTPSKKKNKIMKRNNIKDEALSALAEEARSQGENDLAIVLYTYLGCKHVGMDSEFARYCQTFAKEGIKEIEKIKLRRN